MTERAQDAQNEALRAFLLLCALRNDWAGKLLLRVELGVQGIALSRAAVVARAACLVAEENAEACHSALRAGACDFVVNNVDEALRILKNEVRKRRPVSVVLEMREDDALRELAERGVAPDLVSAANVEAARIEAFEWFGALRLSDAAAEARVAGWIAEQALDCYDFVFATAGELREFDGRLVAATSESGLRTRWTVVAPQVFFRERPFRRVAYLTADEAAQLQGTRPTP